MTAQLTEIDGLPQAYMEFQDATGLVRFVYKTVRRECANWKEASECKDAFLDDLQDAASAVTFDCIILWRDRIAFTQNKDGIGMYCRFETSPPLKADFWKKWEVKQGEVTPIWRSADES